MRRRNGPTVWWWVTGEIVSIEHESADEMDGDDEFEGSENDDECDDLRPHAVNRL